MTLRDFITARSELDKLALIEPEEDQITHLKMLIARGDDKAHIEQHIDALEGDYPTLDTRSVRSAL